MNIHKQRITMKAFINSKFGYCPLVWMFHSRKLNSRVNKLHEKLIIENSVLRIVYPDYTFSFTEVLEEDNSTTIHKRNIQLLTNELFKVKNGLLLPFMNEIFVENAQHYHDLRKKLNLGEIMLKRCTAELKL